MTYTIEKEKIYYNEVIKKEVTPEELKAELANILANLESLTARKEEIEKAIADYEKI